MSHFTVMVIGNNPEDQLAGYACDLDMPEYCKGEVSEQDKQFMLDCYKKDGVEYESFDACYEENGKEWNENSYRKGILDGIWREYATYNPNAKWDWYALGGRWSGNYIILKPGATGTIGEAGVFGNKPGIDAAYKRDIDFERIFREAYEDGIRHYHSVAEAMGGRIPDPKFTWPSLFEGEFKDMDPEERRAKYNAQDAIKLFNEKISDHPFGPAIEDYLCTDEEFARRKESQAFSTFAYLIDGQWYEMGKMGWFAQVSDAMSQDQWDAEVKKMLEALPDDTLISIYDCHI